MAAAVCTAAAALVMAVRSAGEAAGASEMPAEVSVVAELTVLVAPGGSGLEKNFGTSTVVHRKIRPTHPTITMIDLRSMA